MSFFLKTLENNVLRQIWNKAVLVIALHANQHVYIAGRSCDSTLHHLVCKMEKILIDKKIAIVTLLDSQGVFDNNRTSVIEDSARGHYDMSCGWLLKF